MKMLDMEYGELKEKQSFGQTWQILAVKDYVNMRSSDTIYHVKW